MYSQDKLIVSLDTSSLRQAVDWVEQLSQYVKCFKVGYELLTAHGDPHVVSVIQEAGGEVFLDKKFHDIPNTVAYAIRESALLDVAMVNVHCGGGRAMMQEAVRALRELTQAMKESGAEEYDFFKPPLLLGVTVLTSLRYEDFVDMGYWALECCSDVAKTERFRKEKIERLVERQAYVAQECGLDGAICSPNEIVTVREKCGKNFIIVTPGVRPEWAEKNDQERTATPYEAIMRGADYVVVGRPITNPPEKIGSPENACRLVLEEIASAMDG
jgi:orotidine-5'-phosphate decarboxylase